MARAALFPPVAAAAGLAAVAAGADDAALRGLLPLPPAEWRMALAGAALAGAALVRWAPRRRRRAAAAIGLAAAVAAVGGLFAGAELPAAAVLAQAAWAAAFGAAFAATASADLRAAAVAVPALPGAVGVALAPWSAAGGELAAAWALVVAVALARAPRLPAAVPAGAPRRRAFAAGALWALAAGLGAAVAHGTAGAPATVVAAPCERLLAAADGEAVVYGRRRHERQWRGGGGVRVAVGPERPALALAATLARAVTRPGDRVLALGATAPLLGALAAGGDRVVDAVDERPHAAALHAALAGDGPVPMRQPPALGARPGALAVELRALPIGARQAIVVGALPTPRADHADLQRDLARTAAVALQPLALDLVDAATLQRLLAAAGEAFPWLGLVAVGDDAVLVGAVVPAPWRAGGDCAAWPADARWLAHAAHIGAASDLDAACRGFIDGAAAAAWRPAPGVAAVADLLRAAVREIAPAADAPAPADGAVFAAWRAQEAALAAAVARLRALPADADGRAAAAALAAQFLPIGVPRAELTAALGLAGADGVSLAAPTQAAAWATALDPCWRHEAPPVLAVLPPTPQPVGVLEDLAELPPLARLAELAAGDGLPARALRASFPSACARALVAALADGPLPAPAAQALRELADPFVLREAAATLAQPGRQRELLGLWRGGLPMPADLGALAHGSADDRRALAVALLGRREPSCAAALADLLLADEADVRGIAASALEHQFPGRVAYDPSAPLSVRRAAAQQVRSLHNRAP